MKLIPWQAFNAALPLYTTTRDTEVYSKLRSDIVRSLITSVLEVGVNYFVEGM